MRIKILKKFIGMILVLAMSLVLVTPAFAVDQCRASRDEQISAILDSVDMEGLYGEAEENMEQGQNENPYENISITCTATCENTMTRSSPAIDTEYGYAVRELGTLYDQ